jgi:flagellar basal-body rod modification protein FlgD
MQITHQPNATSLFQAQSAATPGITANDDTSDSGTSSSSGTATATITANDFLQLLVTELQNQDPTANTDPNQYVDQLVQVNSLQQQIQMNQTLDGGPTLTGASSGVLQELTQMNQTLDGDVSSSDASGAAAKAALHAPHASSTAKSVGNLGATANAKEQAAAEKVATALAPGASHAAAAQTPSSQQQAFEQFAARLRANAAKK